MIENTFLFDQTKVVFLFGKKHLGSQNRYVFNYHFSRLYTLKS